MIIAILQFLFEEISARFGEDRDHCRIKQGQLKNHDARTMLALLRNKIVNDDSVYVSGLAVDAGGREG
jgi:transposase-like protein